MANLTPTASWDDVFQLETTTPVLGGPGGPSNLQAQALLNRTEVLKNEDTAVNARARAGFTYGGAWSSGMSLTQGYLYTGPDGLDYISRVTGAATSTAPASNTNQFYRKQNVREINVVDFAVPTDGTTDATTALTTAISQAGRGELNFLGLAYSVTGISGLSSSKLKGGGAILRPLGNNQTVFSLNPGLSFQAGDYQLCEGFVVDGAGKTGITGFKWNTDTTPSGYIAAAVARDLVANSCDTVGFDMKFSQFSRLQNLRATGGNGVGLSMINDSANGGANSQDIIGLHVTNHAVGVFIDGTAFTVVTSNNFYNPQILGNGICGIATFNAYTNIYGAAPESNAGAAGSTYTYNGKTIKKSSIYINNSVMCLNDYQVSEATANPCFYAENNSVFNARNITGYGTNGDLFKCDSTSVVNLSGTFGALGKVQNVGTWMEAWDLPDSAPSMLYGSPACTYDPTIAFAVAEQAPKLNGYGGSPPPVVYAEHASLGYTRQISFFTSVGPGADFPLTFNVGEANAISFIVIADRDCSLQITVGAVGNANFMVLPVTLKANSPTRVLLGAQQIPTGVGSITFSTLDTTGPVVNVANFVHYRNTIGLPVTTETINKIARYGAWNSGKTRDTATNLASLTATVNTSGKYPGKQVWDTTNNRFVVAAGQAANAVWKDGVNSTVYTPV